MITLKIDDKTTQLAINTFGVKNQKLTLAEECSECSAAVIKSVVRPSIDNENHAIDEIADALIMLDQACKMYSVEEIQKHIDYKIQRLQGLIERALHERI